MKLERLAVATAALILGVTACAADRGKQVKQAEADLTSAQAEAAEAQARLDEKQAREAAEAQQRGIGPEEQAELVTEQVEEQAETKAKGAKEVAEAKERAAGAQAGMTTERTKVEADAKERLTKAEARVAEAKTKSGKLTGGKRAQYDAEMRTFDLKKDEVRQQLDKLGRVTDEEWKDAKTKLDKSLDHLEAAVKRLEKDL